MKEILKKFIPDFFLDCYHFILAFLGAVFYCFPSKNLKVIGITGTSGKSTVVEMASKILETAGYKVASLSSIRFKIGDKEWKNELRMTMPGRFFLQRFLKRAAKNDCQYAVLEVTSEGIKQFRHKFINFEVAVLTNLSPEHIEAHGGFENYRAAKRKLFQATKGIHVVNLDDENKEFFLKFTTEQKWAYKIGRDSISTSSSAGQDSISIIKAENIQVAPRGLKFFLDNTEFKLNLLGEFNIYNALAAICVGRSQKISLTICQKALEEIQGIPGRMEEVISKPFKVFVDYALTPNALQKVYETLSGKPKFQNSNSKMICVLGACGGGRDKWKRPVLGEIAARYCDEVIVTNEDPYNEEPIEIINQVAAGAENISLNQPLDQPKSAVYKILDRRKAINKALNLAKQDDIVIITGKGCEPSICLSNKKIPWDDRRVVKEEFEKLKIDNIF